MIGDLGGPELLIILVIVVVLFGAGRVARIGGDLGTAIKDFRKAMKDDSDQPAPAMSMTQTAPVAPAQTMPPSAPSDAAHVTTIAQNPPPPQVF